MKRTAVIYTRKYMHHDPGPNHPESPSRLRFIMEELKMSDLLKTGKCSLIAPEPASIEQVELVHEPDHIKLVKRLCALGGGLVDLGDTMVSRESLEVALLAVGGSEKAVDLVMNRKFRNAFALVRPPGHHAGPYYAMGFCLFNNAAIAAVHLLRNFNLERILVLDVDAHHGNGTQEVFYGDDAVLYVSLHQDPTEFPGTGFVDEVGKAKGLGYTVNIPFPFRIDDAIYLEAFDQVVVPIIQQYKPQFIIVSTGFDSHHSDPVGNLSLSALTYTEIFGRVLELASKLCMGKMVAILEGGYSLPFLGRLAVGVISKMAGLNYPLRDKHPVASSKIRKRARRMIEEVKRVQSEFWDV